MPTTTPDLDVIRTLVRENARAHGRVFRRRDLVDLGLDPDLVKTMMRRRWWTRLHHGVYADVADLDPARGNRAVHLVHCAAAIRALPGPAFAWGPSAALAHDLPIDRNIPLNVTLTRGPGPDQRALHRRVSRPSLLVDVDVHSYDLGEQDRVNMNGVWSASRDIAAIGAAARSTDDWAVVTLDAAAWRRPAAPAQLVETAEAFPRLRGIGTVRRVAPLVRSGAQTPLETLSRLRLVRCSLPEPALQVAIYDGSELAGVVDMLWREWRIVGEADGAVKYNSRDDLLREKEREDRIRSLGYSFVRWTWREIMTEPQSVARRIRKARAHSQRSVA